jgi:sugar-specific transcriptional regulator TrmB
VTKLNHHRRWGEAGLSEEKIKRILRDFGLTETEGNLYLFLARRGALKGTEIARQVKKDKAQVYHVLKILQAKGLVEATLEAPIRFTTVPFEKVVESAIKAKRDEAARIESIKQELFDYWKTTSRARPEAPLEKFMVIKGNKKIYPKILQMINETKSQLSVVSTVQGLLRADQFGLLDAAFDHPLKAQVQFRFLTELSQKNVNAMKILLKKKPRARVNFKGRNPNLGLHLSPRMVIRDEEEILLFITPRTDFSKAQDEMCLWTNGKMLVQSFGAVFENLWTNSTDINKKIAEIETGKPTPTARVISDARTARKTYDELMNSAEKEIILMTSSKGLIESWKSIALLKERIARGVSVKIMAPIIKDNLRAAQELLKFCAVRHVPTSYFDTVIVDGKRLFQSQASTGQKPSLTPHFYTDDLEYVEKTQKMLNDVWRNARVPSAITLESFNPYIPAVAPRSVHEGGFSRPDSLYEKLAYGVEKKPVAVTEKDILNKIINAKKYPANWPNDPIRLYGSTATAVIHPPKSFNLPNIMIVANHLNKQSSFGAGDVLHISMWLETPKGYAFIPVARVSDDTNRETKGPYFGNAVYAGTPAGQNVQLVKKDELQIRFHGNTFFAGWTKPIPLVPSKYTLPPACILLEGYGKLVTSVFDFVLPSGARINSEVNGFDAFVTFFHPASKYSGPGTDGTIGRDVVATIYPP